MTMWLYTVVKMQYYGSFNLLSYGLNYLVHVLVPVTCFVIVEVFRRCEPS